MSKHRNKAARSLILLMVLALAMTSLTGCKKEEHSIYSDGTVTVPDTYASYTVEPMTFRFEAGWTSANFDDAQNQMEYLGAGIGVSDNLCIYQRLKSPVYDQGTVNYLDFGYMQIGHTVEMTELEEILENFDQLSSGVKKLELASSQLQNARIRAYGDNEIEALTVCYRISASVNGYTISCVEQLALIPIGSRIYLILYSDFTNTEDDPCLERLLSSMTITE